MRSRPGISRPALLPPIADNLLVHRHPRAPIIRSVRKWKLFSSIHITVRNLSRLARLERAKPLFLHDISACLSEHHSEFARPILHCSNAHSFLIANALHFPGCDSLTSYHYPHCRLPHLTLISSCCLSRCPCLTLLSFVQVLNNSLHCHMMD